MRYDNLRCTVVPPQREGGIPRPQIFAGDRDRVAAAQVEVGGQGISHTPDRANDRRGVVEVQRCTGLTVGVDDHRLTAAKARGQLEDNEGFGLGQDGRHRGAHGHGERMGAEAAAGHRNRKIAGGGAKGRGNRREHGRGVAEGRPVAGAPFRFDHHRLIGAAAGGQGTGDCVIAVAGHRTRATADGDAGRQTKIHPLHGQCDAAASGAGGGDHLFDKG
jgi:hypothetical protein